jgi:hypothetical protein
VRNGRNASAKREKPSRAYNSARGRCAQAGTERVRPTGATAPFAATRGAETEELRLHRLRARAYDDPKGMAMWKNHLIGAGLSLCVAACASTPSSPSPGAATSKAAAAPNLPPVGCVSNTATRIPMSPAECAAFGRAWTDQDIKTTGATNSAQALRLLDPSVTVTGN